MKPFSMNHGTTLCLALLAVCFLAFKGFSQSPDPNFFIFLAFGQSNMEGYPGQMEKQDSANLPDRFKYLPALDWPDKSRTKGVWTKALPPLCRNTTGLCPCDYFGRTLCDSLPQNVKIGIINVAVAGCAIECFDKDKYQAYLALSSTAQWLRDDANLYGGSPYARLVEMGKVAQKDGVIKGFLLHQGESGTGIAGDNWSTEVKKIYFDFINDLSLDSNKTPILAGDLTNDNGHSSCVWQLNKAPKVIKNAYVISSDGCPANSSGQHFSGPGYRELGKRYADSMLVAFKKLGSGPTGVADKRTKFGHALNNGIELNTASSSVSFEIPQRAFVTLKAYTVGGKEIAELAGAEYVAGKHVLEFGRTALRTGVFVLKMNSGSFSVTRTVMVAAH